MGVTRNGFRHDFTNYYSPTDSFNPRRQLPGGGRTTLVAINTFNDPRTFAPPTTGRRRPEDRSEIHHHDDLRFPNPRPKNRSPQPFELTLRET